MLQVNFLGHTITIDSGSLQLARTVAKSLCNETDEFLVVRIMRDGIEIEHVRPQTLPDGRRSTIHSDGPFTGGSPEEYKLIMEGQRAIEEGKPSSEAWIRECEQGPERTDAEKEYSESEEYAEMWKSDLPASE